MDLTIERMAQNATAARRIGDERTADYWTERVELELARSEREAREQEWAALKGSPEHG